MLAWKASSPKRAHRFKSYTQRHSQFICSDVNNKINHEKFGWLVGVDPGVGIAFATDLLRRIGRQAQAKDRDCDV